MSHAIATIRVPRRVPNEMLLSFALFAYQVWMIRLWIQAFDLGGTQVERVEIFLQNLPPGLGQLGVHAFSWLSVFLSAAGVIFAGFAVRGPAWSRVSAVALILMHALLILWYLFTLM